jgi:SPP1 gp7 family putative phage head morphogenesis protein
MAIRQPTLRIGSQLRIAVGTEADQATRRLTQAWVRAWDVLSGEMQAAVTEIVAMAGQLGHWPAPWELARVPRLVAVLRQAEEALAALGSRTGVEVTDAAGAAITVTADTEPRLIASQLPAAQRVDAVQQFASRILPSALDVIVSRSQAQIAAQTRPLAADASEAMHRELIRGVAVGASPRETAQRMMDRVEGHFNGGLSRALTIARTETLDAYRVSSQYTHAANGDVVTEWVWLCHLGPRTCPACLAMNGTVHPVSEPGPLDHPSGRCSRMPKTKSWRDLGIDLDEPPDTIPDARAWFVAQPEETQIAIMGPSRHALLKSGKIDWDDLAVRRPAPVDWRPSYTPTAVRDLQRKAGVPVGPAAPRRPAAKPLPKRRPAAVPTVIPADAKVGDLFMTGYSEKRAVTAQRKAAVETVFNGKFGGLNTEVTAVTASHDRVRVDGIIRHPDGRHVGLFSRAYYRDGDTMIASHSLLELNSAQQGQGFSKAFNRHLEDWYRRSGVDHIVLHANIDVGGFAWARAGYDFRTASDATAILARLESKADAYRKILPQLNGSDADLVRRQIAAADAILQDAQQFNFGEDGYPTAYRISQAGWWKGAGRDESWIGKETLLRSSWKGVKPL